MSHTDRQRLAALRALLTEWGGHGFLVPRSDAYQGEYVAPCDERLAWLTGFTGSAGMAVILKDKAAIFVDGRYTLQARNQVDPDLYEICPMNTLPPCTWGKKNLGKGEKLFYDPWLHTLDDKKWGEKACEAAGAEFVPLPQNPIDQLWVDRPARAMNPIYPHGIQYAGLSSAEKCQSLLKLLHEKKADAVIISAPASLSWLLNIRGNDIPCTPVVQGFGILWAAGAVDLFIPLEKITSDVKAYLGASVRCHDLGTLESTLKAIKNKVILIDPTLIPVALVQNLEDCQLIHANDPCALPKALKNKVEREGMRQAHIADGVAVTRFFAWLSKVPVGTVTEMDVAGKLLTFRQKNPLFVGPSFETISGAGANGAIIHYRATPETNRLLAKDSLFLLDSGGQYPNGTTDITRTIAIGVPTLEQKDRFTRVLKGHIALATALFPAGTTGSQLDSFARQFLWQAGLDYDHGTGHGVGSFLNVHEGPQRISKSPSTVALQPGMIVSNEPGYYKTGAYGIRIESLILVVEKGIPEGGERPLLGFETLTLVPIDTRLIQLGMLTPEERSWLNGYHAQVRKALQPHLDEEEAQWVTEATREI
jgi:Xaa-Pro aminopeptidase